MLKIKDKNGKVKWVLRDDDEEPVSIDELILTADQPKSEQKDGSKKSAEGSIRKCSSRASA